MGCTSYKRTFKRNIEDILLQQLLIKAITWLARVICLPIAMIFIIGHVKNFDDDDDAELNAV